MSYISWGLVPPERVIRYETLLDLTIAAITPETFNTQYQQEFYCGLRQLIGGSFVSPEYGTKVNVRPLGRIDFFIEAKGWGIGLLRDENDVIGHGSRFDVVGGAFGPWIPVNHMEDYVILDFRWSKPGVAHPDIPKLYHVVFADFDHRFTLLDNSLNVLHTGRIGES